MTTYADMYTRIGDEIQDATALLPQIQNAIQDAIAFHERSKFYFNTDSNVAFSTVRGQEWYYSPADFPLNNSLVEIISMAVSISGVLCPLQAEDYEQLDRAQNGSITGPPRAFSYFAECVRLFPIPDAVYPVIFSFHSRLPPLVNPTDTNAWMTDAEMLIRQTAKVFLATDVLQEAGIAQGAQILADKALAQLQMETRKRRSNRYLKTDLPVREGGGDVRSGETW